MSPRAQQGGAPRCPQESPAPSHTLRWPPSSLSLLPSFLGSFPGITSHMNYSHPRLASESAPRTVQLRQGHLFQNRGVGRGLLHPALWAGENGSRLQLQPEPRSPLRYTLGLRERFLVRKGSCCSNKHWKFLNKINNWYV